MKRLIMIALLVCALAALLSVTAFAADKPTTSGIYDLTVNTPSTTTVEAFTATGTTKIAPTTVDISGDQTFYAGAEKLTITLTGATAAQYLILAQDDTGSPTESNIRYIDQVAPTDNTATFLVFPDKMENGKTYYIFIAGTGGEKEQIASFKYYLPYKLGDVDQNTLIEVTDALAVLEHIAGIQILDNIQKLAADVDFNKEISVLDVLGILEHIAGIHPFNS